MLTTDGPMTYSKAPWYATSGLIFYQSSWLFCYLLGAWLLGALDGSSRRLNLKKLNIIKGNYIKMGCHCIWILISGFVFGIAITGEIDPVYGLPKVALGILPTWSSLVDLFPYGMVFWQWPWVSQLCKFGEKNTGKPLDVSITLFYHF